MKRVKVFPGINILLLLLCTACSSKVFYEKMDTIPNEVWNIDSVLHYEVEITDTLQYYNIYVNVRNTTDYETQMFYLFMTSEFPNGFLGKDTLGCVLSDQFGKWTGSGSGRIKDNHFLYKVKVRFPVSGVYKFSFVQGMREENVQGIANFGLSLYYFEKDKLKMK